MNKIQKIYRNLNIGMLGAALLMLSDWLAGVLGTGNTKNGLIESNWFLIDTWRFIASLVLAAIGSYCFYHGMKAMVQVVTASRKKEDYQDVLFAKIFSAGGTLATISLMYTHLIDVLLPILYKELYETSLMGADIISIVERVFFFLAVPYYLFRFAPMILVSVSFMYFVVTGGFRVSRLFLIFNPLILYGIGLIVKMIRVAQIADLAVAFVSLGYLTVFIGGGMQLTYIYRRMLARKKKNRREE